MRSTRICFTLLSACGSSAPETATPTKPTVPSVPAVQPNSIVVSGTRSGASFTFTCNNPGHELGADTSVSKSETSFHVSCADAATGLAANCTVHLTVGDQPITDDESTGRINLNFQPPGKDDGFDQVTTSASGALGSARGTGTTTITSWDAGTGHIVGSSTMTWEKDNSGAPGTLTIAFDVIAP